MNLRTPTLKKLFEMISYHNDGHITVGDNDAVLWEDGTYTIQPSFYKNFPFNNPDSPDKLGDLIDTIWIDSKMCSSASREAIFRNANGDTSELSLKHMKERLDNARFNHATLSLLKISPPTILRELGYIQSFRGIPSDTTDIILVNGREEFGYKQEYGHIFENRGFIWHHESQSWWSSKYILSDGTIPDWEKMKPCECERCSSKVPKSILFEGLCKKCLNLTEEDISIHSYSTRAPTLLSFKGKIKQGKMTKQEFNTYYNKYLKELSLTHSARTQEETPIYLGLELEYERVAQAQEKHPEMSVMRYLKGHAILKSDGSLKNGFEIVTCPATIDEHEAVFKSFFDNFPRKYIKSASTCGLHVHISRAPLSLLTQGRMIAFMNSNENGSFLESIAGRRENKFANSDSNRGISHIFNNSSVRYNVLNTNNKDTLEFRLFAPATSWDKFFYKLEFCLSLAEYCTPCNTSLTSKENALSNNFIIWMRGRKKDYPELHKKLFGEKPILAGKVHTFKKGKHRVHSHL